jgi:hypothetical protein
VHEEPSAELEGVTVRNGDRRVESLREKWLNIRKEGMAEEKGKTAHRSNMPHQHGTLRRQKHALQVHIMPRWRLSSQNGWHQPRQPDPLHPSRLRVDLIGGAVDRGVRSVPAETATVDVGQGVLRSESRIGGRVLKLREVMLINCSRGGCQ